MEILFAFFGGGAGGWNSNPFSTDRTSTLHQQRLRDAAAK